MCRVVGCWGAVTWSIRSCELKMRSLVRVSSINLLVSIMRYTSISNESSFRESHPTSS